MIVKWNYDYASETIQYCMMRHGKLETHSLRKGYYKRLILSDVIHADSVFYCKKLHHCIKNQQPCEDVDLICKDHHGMYRHYTIRYRFTYHGDEMIRASGVAILGELYVTVEESMAR